MCGINNPLYRESDNPDKGLKKRKGWKTMEIRHFGVKGMKWGVRKDRSSGVRFRKRQAREVWRITQDSQKKATALDKTDAKIASRTGRGASTAKLEAKRAKLAAAKNGLDALGKRKASTLTATELARGERQAKRNKRLRRAAVSGLSVGAATGALIGGPAGAGLGAVVGGVLNPLGSASLSAKRRREARQSWD